MVPEWMSRTGLDASLSQGGLVRRAAQSGARRPDDALLRYPRRRTAALQAQARRGFAWLRFDHALEPFFRDYLRGTSQGSRTVMLLMTVLLSLSAPVIGEYWVRVPHPVLLCMVMVDWCGVFPMACLCGVVVWFRHTSPSADWATIALLLVAVVGIVVQRIVAARYDFDVPVEIFVAPVLAVLTIGRLPFWRLVAIIALLGGGVLAAQFVWGVSSPADRFHVYAAAMLTLVALCGGYSVEYFIRWSWLSSAMLGHLARSDGLTGLLNRAALEESIGRAHREARAARQSYGLALVDVDRFGAYNDHFGHQAGDAALRDIAGILVEQTEAVGAICGRYGGEEFLVLWPKSTLAEAHSHADALRAAVSARAIPAVPDGEYAVVTASVGLCVLGVDAAPDTGLVEVIGRADQMLYAAKAAGRNRTRSARLDVATASASRRTPPRRSAQTSAARTY